MAYSLHVRGFTKGPGSKVKNKGTFSGLVEKIPYLKELGINQIQCMPVYEFRDHIRLVSNYWGYGEAYCFAPKVRYAERSPIIELKQLVKSCHKEGIEVVLHLPFYDEMPKQKIVECLRYYRQVFHVDGFIVNPYTVPMEVILSDDYLKNTKIIVKNEEFQNVMRRFLKGDEGMIESVIWHLKHLCQYENQYHYITDHTGFTLCDLVSYDGKHNEMNGENNHDGPDYNYSWNCGVEEPLQLLLALQGDAGCRGTALRDALQDPEPPVQGWGSPGGGHSAGTLGECLVQLLRAAGLHPRNNKIEF